MIGSCASSEKLRLISGMRQGAMTLVGWRAILQVGTPPAGSWCFLGIWLAKRKPITAMTLPSLVRDCEPPGCWPFPYPQPRDAPSSRQLCPGKYCPTWGRLPLGLRVLDRHPPIVLLSPVTRRQNNLSGLEHDPKIAPNNLTRRLPQPMWHVYSPAAELR